MGRLQDAGVEDERGATIPRRRPAGGTHTLCRLGCRVRAGRVEELRGEGVQQVRVVAQLGRAASEGLDDTGAQGVLEDRQHTPAHL